MKFRTRAKTAYGLLSEIRRLILEEPLRYNQADTLDIKGVVKSDLAHYDVYPACGTIGCVAGWTTVLTASRPSRVADVMDYAERVLGLSYTQRLNLFAGHAAGNWATGQDRQTPEHARAGAAHILRFQQDNAAQLKRTKL